MGAHGSSRKAWVTYRDDTDKADREHSKQGKSGQSSNQEGAARTEKKRFSESIAVIIDEGDGVKGRFGSEKNQGDSRKGGK